MVTSHQECSDDGYSRFCIFSKKLVTHIHPLDTATVQRELGETGQPTLLCIVNVSSVWGSMELQGEEIFEKWNSNEQVSRTTGEESKQCLWRKRHLHGTETREEREQRLAAQRRRYFEEQNRKERNTMHANIQHTDKDISNKAWPIWFAWTKVWGTRLKNKITSKTNSMNNGLFQHSWMVNPSFTFDANYVLNTSLFSMLLTGRRNTVGTYI